jgi:hypothetical protein
MTIHPQAKRWVEVVEFIVYNIGVSVLLNMSAGFTAYWQAGVLALVCLACGLPMLLYLLEHPCAGYVGHPFSENDEFFGRMSHVASTGYCSLLDTSKGPLPQ